MDNVENLTEETFDGDREMNRPNRKHWPLERVLFALAGTMTLSSVVLTVAVSKWFLLLTALVGVNQWLYVLVGACPASVVLRRACHLRSAIYENGDAKIARQSEVTV